MGVHPYGKVHEANMGPTWVLSAPDGPHVGPMNLAIRNHSNNTHGSRFFVFSYCLLQVNFEENG